MKYTLTIVERLQYKRPEVEADRHVEAHAMFFRMLRGTIQAPNGLAMLITDEEGITKEYPF